MRLRCLIATLCVALGCGSALAGCGDTVQDTAVANTTLELLLKVQQMPVYWLGESFKGLPLRSVGLDPGGAYTLQYGDCIIAGQRTCIPPVEIVSSPENSFVPGSGAPEARWVRLRGVRSLVSEDGKVINVATSSGVIDVRAHTSALALAAARLMAPINSLGEPGGLLPKPLPTSSFAEKALKSQRPPVP